MKEIYKFVLKTIIVSFVVVFVILLLTIFPMKSVDFKDGSYCITNKGWFSNKEIICKKI